MTWMRNPFPRSYFYVSVCRAHHCKAWRTWRTEVCCTATISESDRTESPALSPTRCVSLGTVINIPEPQFLSLETVIIIIVMMILIHPTLQACCKNFKTRLNLKNWLKTLLIVSAPSWFSLTQSPKVTQKASGAQWR